jgi:hypothetical protein
MTKRIGLEHSIRNIISKKEDVSEGIANTIGKGLAKAGSKFVPGVGTALGAADTAARAAQGDKTGAKIAAVGTAASVVPGVGGVVAAGADLLNTVRDLTGLSDQPEKKKDQNKPDDSEDDTSSGGNKSSSSPTSDVKVSSNSTEPIKKTKPVKVKEEVDLKKARKKAEVKYKVIDEGFLLETLKKKLKKPKETEESGPTKVIIRPVTKEYKESD